MEKQSRDFCRVQKKKKEGVTMKRKRGLVHVILALLMSMLLIVSTGCGKSGSGDSSSDKKTDKTETLADVNTIPEDGVITKNSLRRLPEKIKRYSLREQQMMELHTSGRMTVQRFRIRQIRI